MRCAATRPRSWRISGPRPALLAPVGRRAAAVGRRAAAVGRRLGARGRGLRTRGRRRAAATRRRRRRPGRARATARRGRRAAARALDLTVVDGAAPGAALLLGHHHVGLEAVHVGPDSALDVTHAARSLLDQRAGLDVDVDLDPRQPRADLVEGDDAGVRDALRDLPLDALVRALLDDLGLELLGLAPDLRLEVEV